MLYIDNMRIDEISFKGYGAVPLKAVIARNTEYYNFNTGFYDMCDEFKKICNSEGIEVIIQTPKNIFKDNFLSLKSTVAFLNEKIYAWTQDNLTFTLNNAILAKGHDLSCNKDLSKILGIPISEEQKHISGGNFFIMPKEKTLIIGETDFNSSDSEALKKNYNVTNVLSIAQPDFHLDMGVRPLNNRNILVNNPDLTLSVLNSAVERLDAFGEDRVKERVEHIRNSFVLAMKQTKIYKNFDKIKSQLENAGYNIIDVPGSVIYKGNTYLLNYMNAIVHERKDGSLLYITNSSNLDKYCGITKELSNKINFSFEKMFKDFVSAYIDSKDIHFLDSKGFLSQVLEESVGGIHCLFAEVPNL